MATQARAFGCGRSVMLKSVRRVASEAISDVLRALGIAGSYLESTRITTAN